jgi:hypothetical protein
VALAATRNLKGETVLNQPLDEKQNLFTKDPQGDSYLNRLDAGVHFGAEFVSTKGMGVGSRAYIGLADITNDKHLLGGGNARTAEISVYAIFRLGVNK